MTSVVAMRLAWREDQVSDGGRPEDILGNAPARQGDYFVVPKSGRMSSGTPRPDRADPGRGARRASPGRSSRRKELAEAHIEAIEAARALNAFITETPERALAMAAESDRAPRPRRGAPARGHPARDQGSVLHRGRPDHRRLAHPRGFRPALRIDGHRQSLARGRGAARQDQPRRVRDGLVQRHQLLRPGGQSLDRAGRGRGRWSRAAARAARRRRSRRICASARPAPIPAARSASRRRSAASSA